MVTWYGSNRKLIQHKVFMLWGIQTFGLSSRPLPIISSSEADCQNITNDLETYSWVGEKWLYFFSPLKKKNQKNLAKMEYYSQNFPALYPWCKGMLINMDLKNLFWRLTLKICLCCKLNIYFTGLPFNLF